MLLSLNFVLDIDHSVESAEGTDFAFSLCVDYLTFGFMCRFLTTVAIEQISGVT